MIGEIGNFGIDSEVQKAFKPPKKMVEYGLHGQMKARFLPSAFTEQSKELFKRQPITEKLLDLLPPLYEIVQESKKVDSDVHLSDRVMLIAIGLTNVASDRFLKKSDICQNLFPVKNKQYPGRVIIVPWMYEKEIPVLQFARLADTLFSISAKKVDLYGYSYGGYYLGLFANHLVHTTNMDIGSLNLELSATNPNSANTAYMKEYHKKTADMSRNYTEIAPVTERLLLLENIPMSVPERERIGMINYFGTSTFDPVTNQEIAIDHVQSLCKLHGVPFHPYVFHASSLSAHRISDEDQRKIAKILIKSAST